MACELVQSFLHIPRKGKDKASYRSGAHQDDAYENLKKVYISLQDDAFTSVPNCSPFKAFQLKEPQN